MLLRHYNRKLSERDVPLKHSYIYIFIFMNQIKSRFHISITKNSCFDILVLDQELRGDVACNLSKRV